MLYIDKWYLYPLVLALCILIGAVVDRKLRQVLSLPIGAGFFLLILWGAAITGSVSIGGLSILVLPALGLTLLAWYWHAKDRGSTDRRVEKAPGWVWAIGFGYGCLMLVLLWPSTRTPIPSMPQDAEGFAYTIMHMMDKGIENPRAAEYFYTTKDTLPYHYLDLWATGMFHKLFNLNLTYTYCLIATPIFITVCIAMLYGLLHPLAIEKHWIAVLSVAGLFTTSWPHLVDEAFMQFTSLLKIPNESFSGLTSLFANTAYTTKLILVLPFFLYGAAMFYRKNSNYFMAIVSFIPFVFLTYVPFVWVFITGFILLQIVFVPQRKANEVKLLALLLAAELAIWLTWYYAGSIDVVQENRSMIEISKMFLEIALQLNIKMLLFAGIPIALYSFWIYKHLGTTLVTTKDLITLLLALVLAFEASIAAWVFFFTTTHDAFQFFTNTFGVAVGLLVLGLAVLTKLKTGNNWGIVVCCILGAMNLFSAFRQFRDPALNDHRSSKLLSSTYANSIFTTLQNIDTLRVGYFRPTNTDELFWVKFQKLPPGYLMRLGNPHVSFVSITGFPVTNPEENTRYDRARMVAMQNAFDQYLGANRLHYTPLQFDTARINFLTQERIQFVLVVGDSQPPLPGYRLVAADTVANERFFEKVLPPADNP